MGAARVEFLPQGREQRTVLLVDRAFAVEMVVVLGDLEHSFARHIAAAQHVLQKWHDVVGPIRPAERHQQHCVVKSVTHEGCR